MSDIKIVKTNDHKIRAGWLHVTSFAGGVQDSEVSISLENIGQMTSIHLSREEGRQLAASLEDVIAALDAGVQ